MTEARAISDGRLQEIVTNWQDVLPASQRDSVGKLQPIVWFTEFCLVDITTSIGTLPSTGERWCQSMAIKI